MPFLGKMRGCDACAKSTSHRQPTMIDFDPCKEHEMIDLLGDSLVDASILQSSP